MHKQANQNEEGRAAAEKCKAEAKGLTVEVRANA